MTNVPSHFYYRGPKASFKIPNGEETQPYVALAHLFYGVYSEESKTITIEGTLHLDRHFSIKRR